MERQIRIVVASPSDVKHERISVQSIVDELNRGIASELGFDLSVARWETEAYPGFHVDGPQGICDSVLSIETCDVLIAILWNRFGTPCRDAASGTEHEFRRAYESWKRRGRPQIMFYFNQKACNFTSTDELEQRTRVMKFREEFPAQGWHWNYRGKAQFEKLLRQHLTAWLRNYNPAFFPVVKDHSQAIQQYRDGFSGFYSRWDLAPVGVAQGGARRPVDVHLDEMYLPLRMSSDYDPEITDLGVEYTPVGLIVRKTPLLISGTGGAGKTTWLRWTFRRLLRDVAALPLIIELRHLAARV